MHKTVLFILSSPLLIGVALAGTGGSLSPSDDLHDGILRVLRMIAHALGLL